MGALTTEFDRVCNGNGAPMIVICRVPLEFLPKNRFEWDSSFITGVSSREPNEPAGDIPMIANDNKIKTASRSTGHGHTQDVIGLMDSLRESHQVIGFWATAIYFVLSAGFVYIKLAAVKAFWLSVLLIILYAIALIFGAPHWCADRLRRRQHSGTRNRACPPWSHEPAGVFCRDLVERFQLRGCGFAVADGSTA